MARSIEFVFDNKMKTRLSAVGSTASQSWGETDLKSVEEGTPAFDKGKDLAGPRVVLATAEWEIGPKKENRQIGELPRKARMAVAGDSDFAANSYLALSANKDVFLNTVGWLLEQENRLSIRPASTGFNPIMFTSGQLQLIFIASVVALPSIVLLIGTLVWIRRRRD